MLRYQVDHIHLGTVLIAVVFSARDRKAWEMLLLVLFLGNLLEGVFIQALPPSVQSGMNTCLSGSSLGF